MVGRFMKYSVILNGCSSAFLAQAEEISSFIAGNLPPGYTGQTIILYSEEKKKPVLAAASPTKSLQLIRVNSYQPESALDILEEIGKSQSSDLYLFPGDFAGSELSTRLACRLNGSSLINVDRIIIDSDKLTCFKPVYNSYLQGRLILKNRPYCLTIARGLPGLLPDDSDSIMGAMEAVEIDRREQKESSFIRERELIAPGKTDGLEQADFILAAGRGVKSADQAGKLKIMAEELGAELGVSRPVAMSAWAPLDRLIGVSGTITSPRLCLAVAVSGAAAFYRGIENSKKIIAINIDENAPIVHGADVAVIDDYEAVMTALIAIIRKQKSKE
jgi:electron transfer flavoprotein alpha subunit